MGYRMNIYFAKTNIPGHSKLSEIRKSLRHTAVPSITITEAVNCQIDILSFDPSKGDDKSFKCLPNAKFDALLSSYNDPPSDVDIELPDLGETNSSQQADALDDLFVEYRFLKGSMEGGGFAWPGTNWRQRYANNYENRANSAAKRVNSASYPRHPIPIRTIFDTQTKPHIIYHCIHLNEGSDDLLRSEAIFLIDVMRGRMRDQRYYMFTTFP
ncbi:MAG: hypothetical protein Q9164_007050, partial [Protoblastenia rupestris]